MLRPGYPTGLQSPKGESHLFGELPEDGRIGLEYREFMGHKPERPG
jgi:hypothetical protein